MRKTRNLVSRNKTRMLLALLLAAVLNPISLQAPVGATAAVLPPIMINGVDPSENFLIPIGAPIASGELDGVFGPEWNDANFVQELQIHDANRASTTFPTRVYLKHDEERLYFALEVEMAQLWEEFWMFAMFDSNGDNSVLSPLDNYVQVPAVPGQTVPRTEDLHAFGRGFRPDSFGGGRSHAQGGGQVVRSGGNFIYRMEGGIPLNSGDRFDMAWAPGIGPVGLMFGVVGLDFTRNQEFTGKCCNPEDLEYAFTLAGNSAPPLFEWVDGILTINLDSTPTELRCREGLVDAGLPDFPDIGCGDVVELHVNGGNADTGVDVTANRNDFPNLEVLKLTGTDLGDLFTVRSEDYAPRIIDTESATASIVAYETVIDTKEGDDKVSITSRNDQFVFGTKTYFQVIGGSGVQTVDIEMADLKVDSTQAPEEAAPLVVVDTGAGDDEATVTIHYDEDGQIISEEEIAEAHEEALQARFDHLNNLPIIDLRLFFGNDRAFVEGFWGFGGRVRVFGGEGDDILEILGNGSADADGGEGNDSLLLNRIWPPVSIRSYPDATASPWTTWRRVEALRFTYSLGDEHNEAAEPDVVLQLDAHHAQPFTGQLTPQPLEPVAPNAPVQLEFVITLQGAVRQDRPMQIKSSNIVKFNLDWAIDFEDAPQEETPPEPALVFIDGRILFSDCPE